jgi:hypothetical protein
MPRLLIPILNNKKTIAMKKNMGIADRIIRILLVVVFVILYFKQVITGTLTIILGLVAVIFLITSLVGVCPLYLPFGIKTCKVEPREEETK